MPNTRERKSRALKVPLVGQDPDLLFPIHLRRKIEGFTQRETEGFINLRDEQTIKKPTAQAIDESEHIGVEQLSEKEGGCCQFRQCGLCIREACAECSEEWNQDTARRIGIPLCRERLVKGNCTLEGCTDYHPRNRYKKFPYYCQCHFVTCTCCMA
jgi:hypothetical protein